MPPFLRHHAVERLAQSQPRSLEADTSVLAAAHPPLGMIFRCRMVLPDLKARATRTLVSRRPAYRPARPHAGSDTHKAFCGALRLRQVRRSGSRAERFGAFVGYARGAAGSVAPRDLLISAADHRALVGVLRPDEAVGE